MGPAQQGDELYSGQTFMEVIDPRSMLLNAHVNQVDAQRIRIGMKAKVHLDAYPGLEYPAHVAGLNALSKTSYRRPDFKGDIDVRVKIDAIDENVLPDISGSADIVTGSEENAVIAPRSAIFYETHGNRHTSLSDAGGLAAARRDAGPLQQSLMRASARAFPPGMSWRCEPPMPPQIVKTAEPMASKDLKLKQRIGRPAWSARKKAAAWIVSLGGFGGAAWATWHYTGAVPVDVAVARVRKGDFVISIKARGEIRSTRSAMIVTPPVPDPRIVHLAESGKPVKKGDVVIEFDAVQQEQNYLDKNTGVRSVDSEIVQLKASQKMEDESDRINLLQSQYNVERANWKPAKRRSFPRSKAPKTASTSASRKAIWGG